MKKICIGGYALPVKDYHCIACDSGFRSPKDAVYLKKDELKLWLYVNVTNRCNAACPFCVSSVEKDHGSPIDPQRFGKVLESIKNHISGISFTGGEPMIYPELLDELIGIADAVMDLNTSINMVTNGTNMKNLARLKNADRLTAIHISRHHYDNAVNRAIMQWEAPSSEDIQTMMEEMNNSSRVVFNCVLQKKGISTAEDVKKYLDHAIALGVRNSSFITMFRANAYCSEQRITGLQLPFVSDQAIRELIFDDGSEFAIWNRHKDHEYCSCMSGDYRSSKGVTRFYLRCPGKEDAPSYCRQLVYTADNHLQEGFGLGRKILVP